jgi:hypothetical protein
MIWEEVEKTRWFSFCIHHIQDSQHTFFQVTERLIQKAAMTLLKQD